MVGTFLKRIKDDRKYFTVVFLILIAIIVSGLLSPILIEMQKKNWGDEITARTAGIENSIKNLFRDKEILVLEKNKQLKQSLSTTLKSSSYQYKELIELVNSPDNEKYSVEIIAPNGKLIAWNKTIAVPQEEIFPLTYPLGETYFFNTGLITYITLIDSVHFQNDIFYLIVSKGIEKHYTIQNSYFVEESFSKEISQKFLSPCTIDYNPFSAPSKDGRIYSFYLLNYKGSKIGQVNFYKPSLNGSVNEIREITTKIQSALVFLACIFIGLGFRKEFININSKIIKFVLLIVYLVAFRELIFIVDFPSMFLSGSVIDPAYFSSRLGWGLIKSPMEFFITNIFLLVIAVQLFRYSYNYYQKDKTNKWWYLKLLIVPLFIIGFFYLLRGFSSAIKSVIFDSTIRYFKDPTPIPDLNILFMNLNVLIFGLVVILVMVVFVMLTGTFTKVYSHGNTLLKYLIFYLLTQVLAYLFFDNIREPLITHLMVIIFITLIYVVVYVVCYKKQSISQLILYCTLIASVISVILMNYFNLELEKKSLKTVAFEIIRANKNLLYYMNDETLRKALADEELQDNFLRKNVNYDAEAFRIWSSSPMQRESISSGIYLYNSDMTEIGNFSVGLDQQYDAIQYFDQVTLGEPNIKEISDTLRKDMITYIGLIPVAKRDIVTGYIAAVTEFNVENIGSKNIPEFLQSNKEILGSAVDESLLKIFEFRNSRLEQVYGDIYPSREQIATIYNSKLSVYNDAWITFSIYGENYIAYIVKLSDKEEERMITVAAKENEITWNLFNFFKIFLLHSIFMLLLFLVFKLSKLLKTESSFRTRLLYAFMFVSIVPLALLAVYNREVVSESSEKAVVTELSKRSDYLENHVTSQLSDDDNRELVTAFRNAGRELNISFAVYQNTDLLYSSREELYRTGLFNYKLNSEAHYNLNYLSYREHLSRENLDDYSFDAYYRKVTINGVPLIIGVNDAFNKIKPALSTSDIDVILFGIYAFAAILIILASTILANQISAPIRNLTKATEVVAKGDLNVELKNKEKGEMKDLYDGFNMMTKELQKNQIELAELERESAWKEMAKQVAHEIKNPLTPIKLAIQQLIAAHKDKSSDFDKIFKSVTKTTLHQIDNLSQIASEFSSFAKMPSIKLEILDFVPIIRDTVNLFVDDKIKIDFENEIPAATIEGDASQLRRMLINMIRNSIQANASHISIKLKEHPVEYLLIIDDNGEGIKNQHKDKIFEMNFTTKDKGMGLGLKLAKRFLEGINGQINLVESSRSGTIFGITIPKFNTTESS